jgi:hypothetical protein
MQEVDTNRDFEVSSLFSVLLDCIVLMVGTIILEEHNASAIFNVEMLVI